MEKNTQGIVAVFAILALLVGFSLGAILMGEDTETRIEVEVEKIVNVTVVELVEVPAPDMLSLAVDAFMQAVEDEEDEAGRDVEIFTGYLDDYYFDEVEVRSVDDDYIVEYDGDKTKVYFTIDLRFDDGDDREKESYDVRVVFEDDEDTKVTIIVD